jgi:hypothetical protein
MDRLKCILRTLGRRLCNGCIIHALKHKILKCVNGVNRIKQALEKSHTKIPQPTAKKKFFNKIFENLYEKFARLAL